ncbi:MAG: glycosyltransferase [Bryobacteraceae bacterium]
MSDCDVSSRDECPQECGHGTLKACATAVLRPVLALVAAIVLVVADLAFVLFGRRKRMEASAPRRDTASIVIPNWNGSKLLEEFLPSVLAAAATNPENEIIVVDNASTDGSAAFLQEHFPGVRVLALDRNLGFGGGSNEGFRAARNEIVVLLNNDMRVEPDFLAPLLAPFADPLVFSVSCQIFFADPAKRREETGLTQTWWEAGRLRASHRVDPVIDAPFPCGYPGGGSSAFDRRKFLELGGFDRLLRPFYYEDTDLGHMAWKRGWKVLYQPRSIVHHVHRGTIGKAYSAAFIEGVINKNRILFAWKNIHDWRMLSGHFAACLLSAGLVRAFAQLPEALQARWRARSLAVVSDTEAFRRHRGAWFRDRFSAGNEPVPEKLRVLFLAPYPILPPTHGGAVLMNATLRSLVPLADVHLIGFVEKPEQVAEQAPLARLCASARFFVRCIVPPKNPSTLIPHAIREFTDADFAWAIDRTVYLRQIDVVQIDYTVLGSYAASYRHIPCILFEHDIFFQSLGRGIRAGTAKFSYSAAIEFLRMLRYELRLWKQVARVQVCSAPNANYLLSYAPQLRGCVDSGLRAAIDVSKYCFVRGAREPKTMLFVGSFRHTPNVDALNWFADRVLPRVLAAEPEAKLIVIGSDLPENLKHLQERRGIEMLGCVADLSEAWERYCVFVCPILSGSGVRVKLLEAFASGIPAVSTSVGAEGLTSASGEICELADAPDDFAAAILRLFSDSAYAGELAARARERVVRNHDAAEVAVRLEASYREEVTRRRAAVGQTIAVQSSASVVAYGGEE